MNALPVGVDAGVAVKWVVTVEAFSANAQALLRDCIRTSRLIVGPPHVHGEVANALHQRTRSRGPDRRLLDEEAATALQAYLALPVTSLAPTGLLEAAFTLAREHSLPSIYDGLYVVLAQLLGIELWTADRRLLNALGPSAPWVRFIGDYRSA